MELLLYTLVAMLVAVAIVSVAVDGLKRGWISIAHQDIVDLEPLRKEITELKTINEDMRRERNQLILDRERDRTIIDHLRKRIEQLEKSIRRVETISILGIWPQTGAQINQKEERRAIYDAGLSYKPLTGPNAAKSHILRELRHGRYTILEIGAHATEDGTLFLHDGEVTPGWWQRAVTERGIRIAILLACYSDQLATAMLRAGILYVVAVSGSITDDAAIEFAREFYLTYAEGLAVEEAVSQAKLALPTDQAEMISLLVNVETDTGGSPASPSTMSTSNA